MNGEWAYVEPGTELAAVRADLAMKIAKAILAGDEEAARDDLKHASIRTAMLSVIMVHLNGGEEWSFFDASYKITELAPDLI